MLSSVKAVVLAAGKGERLRGFVDDIPKPMIRLRGKPILEHNIEWLRAHGITDIYVNLHHLPNVIKDHFGDGKRQKIHITYAFEKELLGTAGAVRAIADTFWNSNSVNTFLVVHGDSVFKCDLFHIMRFHESKQGIGTVCLYVKDDVHQSGIAVLNDENKIVRFIEKPRRNEIVSNLANAGVYVLSRALLRYIPKNQFSDFGRDIFPKIINSNERLYGIILGETHIAVDTPELLKSIME
jgi:NDP-sugar pyrophosphorylase family protein